MALLLKPAHKGDERDREKGFTHKPQSPAKKWSACKLPTWFNVPPQDHDVLVAVIARLLVEETQRMHEFVHDGAFVLTSLPNGQSLFTTLATDGREAPVGTRDVQMNYSYHIYNRLDFKTTLNFCSGNGGQSSGNSRTFTVCNSRSILLHSFI